MIGANPTIASYIYIFVRQWLGILNFIIVVDIKIISVTVRSGSHPSAAVTQ